MMKCKCGCKQEVSKEGNKYIVGHNSRVRSKETCKKISKSRQGDKHYNWKGGKIVYLHDKAWKLFKKEKCDICNIYLEEYKEINNKKRFDMHNKLVPKNYSIMESRAWQCLCRNCHSSIELINHNKEDM